MRPPGLGTGIIGFVWLVSGYPCHLQNKGNQRAPPTQAVRQKPSHKKRGEKKFRFIEKTYSITGILSVCVCAFLFSFLKLTFQIAQWAVGLYFPQLPRPCKYTHLYCITLPFQHSIIATGHISDNYHCCIYSQSIHTSFLVWQHLYLGLPTLLLALQTLQTTWSSSVDLQTCLPSLTLDSLSLCLSFCI